MAARGELAATRLFRLFVSSTFGDFGRERDVLQADVFPALQQLCSEHGCRFLGVDLRWGVPAEALLDQRTVQICLEELRRCQAVTPCPNFLVLAGNRYGWRPLPSAFGTREFNEILTRTSGRGDRNLLAGWYRLDENAVPPVYELRRRSGRAADAGRWQVIEDRLREIVERAASASRLATLGAMRYLPSITEQEIAKALANGRTPSESAVAVFRTLLMPGGDAVLLPEGPVDASLATFFDADKTARVAPTALDHQRALRERLQRSVRHRLDYAVRWKKGAARYPPPAAFRDWIRDCLADLIRRQIAELEALGEHSEEIARHRQFAEAGAKSFIARQRELRTLMDYVKDGSVHPLVLSGVSGSGKSTLMARAMEEMRDLPGIVVVGRFIGVTPESRNERSLLQGICREIALSYGRPPAPASAGFTELLAVCADLLSTAGDHAPLVVIVDALDQIDAASGVSDLRWIPASLPDGVRMVVSTVPGPRLATLRARLPSAATWLELEPIATAMGKKMLDAWLAEAGRTLNPRQRALVLDRAAGCGWPLYLRLLSGEALRWKSYDRPGEPGRDVHALLRALVRHLSIGAHHGAQLVAHSLAYIAAGRDGLGEDELLELLSGDADVMREFRGHSSFNRRLQRLPPIVWSRLLFDLPQLLTEVGDRRAPLLGFWHRQVRDVVEADLKTTDHHRRLAEFFGARGRSWRSLTGALDTRVIVELPYQRVRAGMWADAAQVLTDFDFLEARCEQSSVYDLEGDFAFALRHWPRDADGGPAVAAFAGCLRSEAHQIAVYPGLLFSQLYNRLRWLDPPIAARCEAQSASRRDWLRATQDPRPRLTRVSREFGGHTDSVDAIALDCVTGTLVSGSKDGTVRVWDPATGELRHTLRGHASAVGAVAWLAGDIIVSGSSDGTVVLSDARAGHVIRVLRGNSDAVDAIAVTPDGARIFSGTPAGRIDVWDAATGRLLRSFGAHQAGILALSVTGDGALLASCGRDHLIRLWSLPDCLLLQSLIGHDDAVSAIAFTPDGSILVSGSHDKTIKAWNWRTGQVRWTNEAGWTGGHTNAVTTVAISADNGAVVSGGLDCRVVISSLRDGKSERLLFAPNDEFGFVKSVAVSGRRVFAGCADHKIHIWGPRGHRPLRSLGGHDETVTAVAIARDGSHFVSGSSDGAIKSWDFTAGRVLRTNSYDHSNVDALAVSADGQTLYAAVNDLLDAGPISVLNVASLRRIRTLNGHTAGVNALALTPDGRYLVSAGWDGTVNVWRAATGALLRTLEGHENGINCVLVTPDGTQIISGSVDQTIRVWDLATGAELRRVNAHADGVEALAISPDGEKLYSCGSESTAITVWTRDLKRLKDHEAHGSGLTALVVTPDGTRLVSAAWDGAAKVWSLPRFRLLRTFDVDRKGVMSIAVTRDAGHLLCGGVEGTVHAHALDAVQQRRALDGHLDSVHAVVFTQNGEQLVSCSADARVKVWDAATGIEAGSVESRARLMDFGQLWGLAVTADGKELISTRGSDIQIANAANGRYLRELSWHDNTVVAIAVAGDRIASGSLDTRIIVGHLPTGRIERVFDGRSGEVTAVALSADGALVAAGFSSRTAIKLWDVASGRLQCRLRIDAVPIEALAFSPRGSMLLSGSASGVISAWGTEPAERKRLLRTYAGHGDAVTCLRFDPLSGRVVSASRDGTIRAWELVTGWCRVLFAGDAPVNTVALSPDGHRLACGDDLGRVRFFDWVR